MTKVPFFTICIPTYNSASVCFRAIESALNQSFDDYDILIIDDRSTDNTREVIEKYADDPRITFITNEENLGLTKNWNKCLKLAKGEYIAFVHHDDAVTSKLLEDAYNAISASSEIGIYVCKEITPEKYFSGVVKADEYSLFIYNMEAIPAPTGVVFKNIENLEYDPNMKYAPETDLYLQILQQGYTAYIDDKDNLLRTDWSERVTNKVRYTLIPLKDNMYIANKWAEKLSIDDYMRANIITKKTNAYFVMLVYNLKMKQIWKYLKFLSQNNYFGLTGKDLLLSNIVYLFDKVQKKLLR